MQLPSALACAIDRAHNLRMLIEAAVRDHRIDPRDVHRHHASRANIQVPDFAVAHLPIRQTDEVIRGMQQRVGKLTQQPVVIRFPRLRNCICFAIRAISPPIQNGQHQRSSHLLRLSCVHEQIHLIAICVGKKRSSCGTGHAFAAVLGIQPKAVYREFVLPLVRPSAGHLLQHAFHCRASLRRTGIARDTFRRRIRQRRQWLALLPAGQTRKAAVAWQASRIGAGRPGCPGVLARPALDQSTGCR